jgi:hypothetical protein
MTNSGGSDAGSLPPGASKPLPATCSEAVASAPAGLSHATSQPVSGVAETVTARRRPLASSAQRTRTPRGSVARPWSTT